MSLGSKNLLRTFSRPAAPNALAATTFYNRSNTLLAQLSTSETRLFSNGFLNHDVIIPSIMARDCFGKTQGFVACVLDQIVPSIPLKQL
jgi:hypothetical protein